MSADKPDDYVHGRGAQSRPHNKFLTHEQVMEHWEAIDEMPEASPGNTRYFIDRAKKIVNKVDSPDIGPGWSLNPYQGCEHGCIYCYARNTHEYWGYNAGLDFESRIIVKPNAPGLLEKHFRRKRYEPASIMISGNTDCYQPAERKFKITRQLLEVFLRYRHPLGIITKNALILRDLDLLQPLAEMNLVTVAISVTTLNNELHHKMEPRTTVPKKRLQTIEALSKAGVPVFVMNAPIIPGLNDHEIPELLKACADAGALGAAYTMVRLNGAIGGIFTDWIHKAYPLKADKVLNRIKDCHQGNLNDSRFGKRTVGDGSIAEMIARLYNLNRKKYFAGRSLPPTTTRLFRVVDNKGQLNLFDGW